MTDPTTQKDEDWHQQITEEKDLLIVDHEGAFVADLGPLDESYYSEDAAEAQEAIQRLQKDANIITGAKRLLRAAKALLERDGKTAGGITKNWDGELELSALQEAVDFCDGKRLPPPLEAIQQPEGNA